MEWSNYLQETVFFVFYDILLLTDRLSTFSSQSPLPSFFYQPVSIEAITMLGPR